MATGPGGHGERTTIVFINLYTEMGGGEYAIYYLLRQLDRSRFRPIMMFNGRGPFVDRVEALGIETVIIPFPSVMLKRLVRPAIIRRAVETSRQMYRYFGNNQVDVIHCTDVISLLFIARAVRRWRIPVIYNVIFFHDRARMWLFNLLALALVDRIITNSNAVRTDLLRRTRLLAGKTSTVYYGIDVSTFRPRRDGEVSAFRAGLRLPPDAQLVAMVARVDTWKGHKTFLEAAARVRQQRKDVRFMVIGGVLNPGSVPAVQRYHDEVMRYRAELGLEEEVAFIPYQTDMPDVLRGLDVLVCPSFREPIPMIVFEAMASGVPVIGADSGGIPEQLDHGNDGYLFRTGDASSLAAVVLECMDAKKERARRASEARRKTETVFSLRRYVDSMQEVYARAGKR
jgi:glycosyltransferase involved in cell wall biosynthesis